MKIIEDSRDWHQKGTDPQPVLDEITRIIWEAGLEQDVHIAVSPRLYTKVKETDYMKLERA